MIPLATSPRRALEYCLVTSAGETSPARGRCSMRSSCCLGSVPRCPARRGGIDENGADTTLRRQVMLRESAEARAKRAISVIAALQRTYPDAYCELNHANPLELLVATILSAQCTDKRVNMVTAELFKRYRTARDFADAPLADLEQAVRSTGFYRNKAKNIQACCRKLVERHGGEVPRTMEELTALDGAGRKTANVVLGNAFGIDVGVTVDTHVGRLSRRLGLTDHEDPVKVERDLMPVVPQADWTLWSHLMIYHGRAICQARKPRCGECPILEWCPTGKKLIAEQDDQAIRHKHELHPS